MNKTLMILFCCSMALTINAADYIEEVKRGNEAYKSKDYKKALEYYHSAEVDLPESPQLEYNLAGALYQQGSYEESVERYTKALNTADINFEAGAHYNLGNTYFRMGDYQMAIKSYENSLNVNPDDVDAKFNLELARRMLKEQIKPQHQDQNQQQQKEQQQPQQQKQEQPNQQQQDQQQDQQQNQQQQQRPQDEKQMSKEDAERILNALRDDEQDIQKGIKRQQKGGNYSGKDW